MTSTSQCAVRSTRPSQREIIPVPVPFGHYLLLERLGSGGMAEVFRAVPLGNPDLDAAVALKRVREDLGGNSELVQMFVDEARIASRLEHPNLGSVLEFGCEQKRYFQTMPYVAGVDLYRLLRPSKGCRTALTPEVAAFVALGLAEGLDHAHRLADESGRPMHLVHRDVNPQNVRVAFDGRVMLLDFGVARARERLTRTSEGRLKGKLSYLAPEQIEDPQDVDGRADLFALGVTLYEMLAGLRPFDQRDVVDLLRSITEGRYCPIESVCPSVPEPLRRIVARALVRDRERRWQTGAEIAFELRRYLRASAVSMNEQRLSELVVEKYTGLLDAEIATELELRNILEGLVSGGRWLLPEHLGTVEDGEGMLEDWSEAREEPCAPTAPLPIGAGACEETPEPPDSPRDDAEGAPPDPEVDRGPSTRMVDVDRYLLDSCRGGDGELPTRPVPLFIDQPCVESAAEGQEAPEGAPARRSDEATVAVEPLPDSGGPGDWAISFREPCDDAIEDPDIVGVELCRDDEKGSQDEGPAGSGPPAKRKASGAPVREPAAMSYNGGAVSGADADEAWIDALFGPDLFADDDPQPAGAAAVGAAAQAGAREDEEERCSVA